MTLCLDSNIGGKRSVMLLWYTCTRSSCPAGSTKHCNATAEPTANLKKSSRAERLAVVIIILSEKHLCYSLQTCSCLLVTTDLDNVFGSLFWVIRFAFEFQIFVVEFKVYM
ncbi:uncharacterized protein LOC125496962 [Beta vulgaris subsp. vulgaris]|uniref:uncharacterized protein LOC125496962 n=1 Tax=Beta vulgaris subsp. vulgaris TaxID=3555 RepID=UPI002036AB66|nr:uncharacterized protein LOC125496962 [Beta vulgaris subsp. vulgaris]